MASKGSKACVLPALPIKALGHGTNEPAGHEARIMTAVRADLTLPELEGLVDKHFAAFQKFGRRTVEEAWQAGHYLNQAKARVAHGGWLGWIEKRGAQPRQAGVDPTVVL